MLSLAQPDAHAFVNWTMPPLLAAYAAAKPAPKIDIIEPILMILPPPAFFISGYAACEHRYALVRFVSMTSRHSASESVSGGLRMLMPALFTRMSRRPHCSTVRWKSDATES